MGRKGKLFRLFADQFELVEIEDQEYEENIVVEASNDAVDRGRTEISLHAFEGNINSSTLRVEGFIKCQSVS